MPGKSIIEWNGSHSITGRTSDSIATAVYCNRLYIAFKGWDNYTIWVNSFNGTTWEGGRLIQGRTSHAPALGVYQGRLYIAYKGWNNDTLWINRFDGTDWEGEQRIEGVPHDSPALVNYQDKLYVAYNRADHSIYINSFNGTRWGGESRLIGRTNMGPTLAVFCATLYIAYKGYNNNTIWINRFDGINWEGERRVNGQTNDSPSLDVYRNYLFMAYKGWNNDTIWLNSHRWIRWEGEVCLEGRTDKTPSLAVYGTKIYMIYREPDSSIHFKSFDGMSWEGEHLIPGQSDHSPAMTIYKGKIYVAHRRSDNHIIINSSSNGRDWEGEVEVRDRARAHNRKFYIARTSDSPAMATHNGKLYIAYKGWNNDSLTVYSFDGEVWEGEQRLVGRTSHAPSLTAFKGRLFIAYKGWNNNTIWINHLAGSRWVGERRIDGCATDQSPALAAFRGKLYIAYKSASDDGIRWKSGYWQRGGRIGWEDEERIPGRSTDSPALAAFGDQLFVIYKGALDHDIYFNIFDKRVGWLGEYDTIETGGLTNASLALCCKEGIVYTAYKGWNDTTLWLNSHQILESWRPPSYSLSVFNPDDPRDYKGDRVKTSAGAPLNHYYETEHLQVYWNENEPDEAISPSDARLVAETIECSWEVYMNPSLDEGYPLRVNLDSPHCANHPSKLPVYVKGVTTSNGASSDPWLQISARGGVTGAASLEWGPYGYAGGTAPHELGHLMNKTYSFYFNSGGSGLWWINEGFVDVYRAILDPDYPDTSPKPLVEHLNLSNQSLLKTNDKGRNFWYSLVRAYTRLHDPETIDDSNWGFYEWPEIPWTLQEMFRMVAGSTGIGKVRRIPGRDVLSAIQEKFGQCHPDGRATPTCGDTEQPQCASKRRFDPPKRARGCVPGRVDGKPSLYRLMPLAMVQIDEALRPFWSTEVPEIPYRAFREFLERNFLVEGAPRTTEVYRLDDGRYRLKSFGAHTHVLSDEIDIHPGTTIRVIITPETDLADGEWAVASFNLRGDSLERIQPWTLGDGEITLTFDSDRHPNPVFILAAFYLGFSYDSTRNPQLLSEQSHYRIEIRTS